MIMFDKDFEYFVHVLMDIDLRQEPKFKLLVEITGRIIVDLESEIFPNLHSHFKIIGHHVSVFKRITYAKDVN